MEVLPCPYVYGPYVGYKIMRNEKLWFDNRGIVTDPIRQPGTVFAVMNE
jgi:hypothetical protein